MNDAKSPIDMCNTKRHRQSFINEGKGFYSFTHRHPHIVEITVVYLIRMQTFHAYNSVWRGQSRNFLTEGKNHNWTFTNLPMPLSDSFSDLFEMLGKL